MRNRDHPGKECWIETKRRTTSTERRDPQRHFREFVSKELNKHQSLGRVYESIQMWQAASDDSHKKYETMQDNGRTLVTDREKATAFNRTYATVSRQCGSSPSIAELRSN